MKIKDAKMLDKLRKEYQGALSLQKKQILICAGTGCVAGGSLKIYDRLKELLAKKILDVISNFSMKAMKILLALKRVAVMVFVKWVQKG